LIATLSYLLFKVLLAWFEKASQMSEITIENLTGRGVYWEVKDKDGQGWFHIEPEPMNDDGEHRLRFTRNEPKQGVEDDEQDWLLLDPENEKLLYVHVEGGELHRADGFKTVDRWFTNYIRLGKRTTLTWVSGTQRVTWERQQALENARDSASDNPALTEVYPFIMLFCPERKRNKAKPKDDRMDTGGGGGGEEEKSEVDKSKAEVKDARKRVVPAHKTEVNDLSKQNKQLKNELAATTTTAAIPPMSAKAPTPFGLKPAAAAPANFTMPPMSAKAPTPFGQKPAAAAPAKVAMPSPFGLKPAAAAPAKSAMPPMSSKAPTPFGQKPAAAAPARPAALGFGASGTLKPTSRFNFGAPQAHQVPESKDEDRGSRHVLRPGRGSSTTASDVHLKPGGFSGFKNGVMSNKGLGADAMPNVTNRNVLTLLTEVSSTSAVDFAGSAAIGGDDAGESDDGGRALRETEEMWERLPLRERLRLRRMRIGGFDV